MESFRNSFLSKLWYFKLRKKGIKFKIQFRKLTNIKFLFIVGNKIENDLTKIKMLKSKKRKLKKKEFQIGCPDAKVAFSLFVVFVVKK